jgi:catechol 2,3-dioxygenase-like lactoylglutathione lyase family enzyme
MAVQALGYLGISTQNIDEWSDFATRQLGLQLVDRTTSSRAFRMDDRRQRVIVDKERPDSDVFRVGGRRCRKPGGAGGEARSGKCRRTTSTGVTRQSAVRDLISFRDPAGNRLEAFYGPS